MKISSLYNNKDGFTYSAFTHTHTQKNTVENEWKKENFCGLYY